MLVDYQIKLPMKSIKVIVYAEVVRLTFDEKIISLKKF